MDLGLAPLEGCGVLVVALDEGVDRCAQLGPTEVKLAPSRVLRARIENQISTWLSQEAWVGVKWKWTLSVPGQPQIPLGLVGLEVVEDDVDLLVWVVGHHLVHEVEELERGACAWYAWP